MTESPFEAKERVQLPDGGSIVLVDRLGSTGSVQVNARNIYRLNADQSVKWQVESGFDNDSDPFTHLHLENGLTAYRWDGGSYSVDLDTGFATPMLLER